MHTQRRSRRTRLRRRPRIEVVALATGGLIMVGALAAAAPIEEFRGHDNARQSSGDRDEAVRSALDGGPARNVILLIGDGMGDSEITSARNYAYGAAGRFPGIDALPLTGQYTTYSLTLDGKPDYAPDSAATGTAWATGSKTYDNALSVDIAGRPQPTLLELAKAAGFKTGNVTTSEIQDATPAVQVAHVSERSCYGPTETLASCPEAALQNGGRGSITEQLINARADVTLGGGAATFAQSAAAGPYAGQTLRQQAVSRGYRIVENAADLKGVTQADQTRPLLGLFASGNLPVRWVGPSAVIDGSKKAPVSCRGNPARPNTQPNLAAMTTKALSLLDRKPLLDRNRRKGFFLQVEGASIDKQNHAADACGQIGEIVDLDEAVQVAMTYAKQAGNTSVFVTADHAHTSQIIEPGSASPGLTVNLLTKDQAPMTINYGTGPAGGSQRHTGSQVRIAGYGPKAANIVGLTDQTDLFFTIASALDLETDPKRFSRNAGVRVEPATVRAGAGFVIDGRRFNGDTAATAMLRPGGVPTDLGKVSVSAGTVSVSGRAPRAAGRYRVLVTGSQSKVTAATVLVVR